MSLSHTLSGVGSDDDADGVRAKGRPIEAYGLPEGDYAAPRGTPGTEGLI